MKIRYIAFLMGLLFVTSCGKEEVLISVEEYISQNNIQVETTESGLMYQIDFAGNDEMPTIDDTARVRYKGFRTDGVVFDSNLIEGFTFSMTSVIPGWTEGLQLFGKGGTGTLYVPAELAYGNSPPENSLIPSNADLIFEIELVNF